MGIGRPDLADVCQTPIEGLHELPNRARVAANPATGHMQATYRRPLQCHV